MTSAKKTGGSKRGLSTKRKAAKQVPRQAEQNEQAAQNAQVAHLRSALVAWYRENKRDLPWRKNRTPYSVWVSEVMLQQTQVETVKPYFKRFMARFPTPSDLAQASEDEVLSEWSGLGYYRRARQLHAGVKEVVARYGGEVPKDADARRSLPSVGPYTAGAIGSLAFGKEEAIVDGNVARVLSRLFFIEAPLYSAASQKALWHHAGALVKGATQSGAKPLEVNEGLMELGALVCRPKSPKCGVCPWQSSCEAHRRGEAESLPKRKPKKKKQVLRLDALLELWETSTGTEVRLKKADEGLFAGLWNVPLLQPEGEAKVEAKPEAEPAEVKSSAVPASIEGATKVGSLVHILTHRRLEITVWRTTGALRQGDQSERESDQQNDPKNEKWVSLDELTSDTASRKMGTSSLTRKILALLERPELPL